LAEDIRAVFSQRTKRQLRIFIDRQEISTAQLWQERISGALRSSAILIAVVTNNYLASQWCRDEWDYFAALERGRPGKNDQRLIFPILLNGEPEPKSALTGVQKWMRAIKSREYVEPGERDGEHGIYRERISDLADDLNTTLKWVAENESLIRADRALEHHRMVTGYVKEGTRFVGLLARAVNVTIVGMTNEGLAIMLQEALEIKREVSGDREAFWASLRIVFLSDKLLNWLNDEKSEYPDPRYELSQRELSAGYGRRSIEGFLKRASSARWNLFESHHFPPIAGALLEMPDGSHIVQLIMRRPQRRTPDHLFIEFEDQADQYFTAAFEDIVHNSSEVNRVVPVGMPRDGKFLCTGARFFQNVLVDRSGQTGWMPIVIVVTWWNRNGEAEPVLQIRTMANSNRELERVSHLANYVYLDPSPGAAAQPVEQPAEFELPAGLINFAARNRIRMETGSSPPVEPNFVTTGHYLHPDKEHLFFYIYEFQLPGHFQFPQRAQMCHLTVDKLLNIRKNQTLRNAIELCRAADMLSFSKDVAFEIVSLNLILHHADELAAEMGRLASGPGADFGQLLIELQQAELQTREALRSGNMTVELKGLSGLQYREFFTMLLPLYAKLGIPGAAEALAEADRDEVTRSALARLAVLYHNEEFMANIPVEL
jgi:hypothetical protein